MCRQCNHRLASTHTHKHTRARARAQRERERELGVSQEGGAKWYGLVAQSGLACGLSRRFACEKLEAKIEV